MLYFQSIKDTFPEKRFFSWRLLRGLTVILLLVFSAAVPAANPIKIGSFLSLTGPASFLGEPELRTLEMYIAKLNSEGGVLDRQLELIHYDVESSADAARTSVKRLLEVDKVDLIIGGSTTGTTMAVIPLVEQAEVPFISLAGAVGIVEPVKKWVFKTPHTDRMAIQKIFADMQDREIHKIALVSGTDGFGMSGRELAEAMAEDYGIAIVADETYTLQDTSMIAQLNNIQNTAGVQAVLNLGAGHGPAVVTKNYRRLGMKWPLYQSHGVASKKYIELAGEAAEGVRLPAGALLVANQLPNSNPQKPVVISYRDAYWWRYDDSASTFGGYAYDGLMIAVEAMQRAGTIDKAKVRKAIEETSGYVGVTGVFHLSPQDHLGLNLDSFYMLEIRNGDWTLIE